MRGYLRKKESLTMMDNGSRRSLSRGKSDNRNHHGTLFVKEVTAVLRAYVDFSGKKERYVPSRAEKRVVRGLFSTQSDELLSGMLRKSEERGGEI